MSWNTRTAPHQSCKANCDWFSASQHWVAYQAFQATARGRRGLACRIAASEDKQLTLGQTKETQAWHP
jgi:hypothetical protein